MHRFGAPLAAVLVTVIAAAAFVVPTAEGHGTPRPILVAPGENFTTELYYPAVIVYTDPLTEGSEGRIEVLDDVGNGTLHEIDIVEDDEGRASFVPANLTVLVQDSVRWSNRGNATHGIQVGDPHASASASQTAEAEETPPEESKGAPGPGMVVAVAAVGAALWAAGAHRGGPRRGS